MNNFKIKFRGVRGSFPVCDRNFLQYGGNTSCIEINAGNNVIILDAGTGMVTAGNELLKKHIASGVRENERTPIKVNIFLSHIHQDHLLGLTFFKPMHLKSTKMNIFGAQSGDSLSLSKNLSELVFGKTFPVDLGDIACEYNIYDLEKREIVVIKSDGETKRLKHEDLSKELGPDDVIVEHYKSYVHPQEGVTIYKITYRGKSVVYATDKECFVGGDKIFKTFAKDCDLLIHDAQYTTEDYQNIYSPKQGYGHSTFDMAIDAMNQTGAKELVFFHYEPSYDDEKLDNIKEFYTAKYKNIQMAYEGLEVDL